MCGECIGAGDLILQNSVLQSRPLLSPSDKGKISQGDAPRRLPFGWFFRSALFLPFNCRSIGITEPWPRGRLPHHSWAAPPAEWALFAIGGGTPRSHISHPVVGVGGGDWHMDVRRA